jgi:hypothetical protein
MASRLEARDTNGSATGFDHHGAGCGFASG